MTECIRLEIVAVLTLVRSVSLAGVVAVGHVADSAAAQRSEIPSGGVQLAKINCIVCPCFGAQRFSEMTQSIELDGFLLNNLLLFKIFLYIYTYNMHLLLP